MKIFFNKLWNYIKKTYVFILITIGLVIVDQVTKIVFDYKNITVINGVFSFTWSHNTGAGFSVLEGKTLLLIFTTIAFLIFIFVFNYFQKNKNGLYKTSMALIISGAIGNLIDRIFLGYVRDFLSFDLINFPIFNFADSCLTIGIILLCVFLIFIDPKLSKQKSNEIATKTENENNIDEK